MIDADKNRAELVEEVAGLREQLAQLSQGDLAERVHFLQAVIDAIPSPIFYKGVDGAYMGCNTAFAEQVLGISKARIIGSTVYDLPDVIPPDLADIYHQQDLDLLATCGVQVYETPVKFTDGERHHILFNKATLTDLNGDVSGMVGVLLDVTDIRQQAAANDALLDELQALAQRSKAAAEVSRATTSILNLDELLSQSVDLILERLALYYVGVFLIDAGGTWAVLSAGTGEAGAQMLADGHRLGVDETSMVGSCIVKKEARIAQDVAVSDGDGGDGAHTEVLPRFENALLPDTRSEMALPLISRGRAIGAMTIQSDEVNAFSENDITVLQTMADQLANAIQNARLFEQMDRTMWENETLYMISTTVSEVGSIQELVYAILDAAVYMSMDSVSLRVFTHWDDAGVPLKLDIYGLSRRGGEDAYRESFGMAFDSSLLDWLFENPRQVLIYTDLAASPHAEGGGADTDVPAHIREMMLQRHNRSMVMAPIVVHGRRQGVLALYREQSLEIESDRYINAFVRTLTDQVSSVLERQFLVAELERRASYLSAASEISRAASSYLDESILLEESAGLIQSRFDLDYVGILMVDDSRQWVLLRAGSGEVGRQLAREGYRLPVNPSTALGACILRNEPMLVYDVEDGAYRLEDAGLLHQQLPDTRSEVNLPLVSRNEVIGALTLRSERAVAFSGDDVTVLTTMTDQLANAISNARLFEQSQQNLEELRRLQQRYALDMWDEYLEGADVMGYTYDLSEVSPLMGFDQLPMLEDGPGDKPVARRGVEGGDGAALLQALEIRGEPVGMMSFEEPGAAIDWSEDQVTVLEAVRDQLELALENRLLIDRSQRALRDARQREEELGFLQEVSALLNATNDVVVSQAELMARLQDFAPVCHLALIGYDEETGQLRFLGFEGEGRTVYEPLAGAHAIEDRETAFFADSGFRWVVQEKTVVSQEDLRVNPRFKEDEALAGAGIYARLLLPLRLGYRTLGVLEMGSAQVNAFSRPGLMTILRQVAAQVASALERGNLLFVAQASAEESQRLYEATSDLAEATDAEAILAAVARHAFPDIAGMQRQVGEIGSDGALRRMGRAEIGLYITDPETGAERDWVEVVAALGAWDSDTALDVGARLPVAELELLHLLGDEQLFVCENVAEDPRLAPELREIYLSQNVHALVVAALATGAQGAAERLGVLLVRLNEPYEVTEQDLRLYHTISDQAAVVLSNRRLFQESQARIERQSVAVALANLTTALSEREALLQESVNFLTERFALYFTGIFLMDDQGQWAVLQAGTGEIGRQLMSMGHRVRNGSDSMVGRCVQRGQRVLNLDIRPASARMENPLLPDMRSSVVFPLISRGQITGAIMLLSDQRFAFTQEDIATLELMVNQLANVIETTNLYERSQSSLAETRMLYRIAQQITDARDAEAVLAAAVDGLSQRREPDWVIAGLLEPLGHPEELRVVVSWSRDGGELVTDAYPLEKITQFYNILQADERFVTPDITQDPLVDDYLRRIYSEMGLRATAAFQLKVRGSQYGMILVHSQNAREFSTAELSFYENVSRQAFVALENISLVDATREQAERRDILNQVLQTASSSLDQRTILRDVGRVVAERLRMPVMMWEWRAESLGPVAIYDAGGATVPQTEDVPYLPAADMLKVYDVIEIQAPVTFEHFRDQRGDGRQGQQVGLYQQLAAPLVEGYAVPLAARDLIYGVMFLGRHEGHEPIDESEREFMRTAAANVSVALETASLYREAQETAEKLQEVDQLKNQFMANMSHELRTPLNSIIGFSRVMLKGIDGPLTDMQETDLSAIYDSGRHLLELINDILDISKINAGKMEIVFEPVDLKVMIKSVLSTALGFVKDKPIKLLSDVPEDLPMVVADGRRVRQVLTNLIGNSGKFTEEGFIKIGATYDNYQVILTVQDSGIGIPPDRIHAVFEQFEQVDSTSTRRYGGTGLGVPLSREFVRMHGGDMWIQESVVGEGTTFAFSLPIGGPDSVREDGELVDEGPTAKVVLTVDDDEGVVTLFRRYLEKQGYRVFGLTSGERVVEEALRLKPYAITLDVLMPGRDGWEIVRDLKANPETRNIPVIICSILGDKDKGLSMGVTDYLVKPISEDALLDALGQVDQQGGYVLVVDDNTDDRKLLRRILENADYEVDEASGGAEAIERIHDRPPNLVVLDLMMPDVDGFAVLENLKRDKATRQIPVVVVTAKELGDEERALLQQRVAALLQKGLFDQQQLLSDVTSALDRLAKRAPRRAA